MDKVKNRLACKKWRDKNPEKWKSYYKAWVKKNAKLRKIYLKKRQIERDKKLESIFWENHKQKMKLIDNNLLK